MNAVLRRHRLQRKLRRPNKLVRLYQYLERGDAGDDESCELIGPGNEAGDV